MSDSDPVKQVYRFGEFTLDPGRAELTGPEGKIQLRPQSFAVLLCLIENCGQLVTKESLYTRIWGERAVTDDSLTQCIIDIRKAIGDTERSIVRTVPRRGFRFAGDVEVVAAAAAPNNSGQRSQVVGIAVAGVIVALLLAFVWLGRNAITDDAAGLENLVVVVPFADLSERGDQSYLGEGLAEDIGIELGQYPELHVIARTSSVALARRSADVNELRQKLNVAFVVEGSVRRTGDHVKIVAQLVDARDSTQVWSHTYEISLQRSYAIQRVIAGSVAEQIVPGLQSTASEPQPTNVSARDLLWLARRHENEMRDHREVNRAKLDLVIRLYRDAVRAEPNSALAHSRLAGALLFGGDVYGAEASVFKALEIDPNLSEVQETLGRYYFAKNRADDAGDAWKKAIALNRNNVDALSSYALWHWIRLDSEEPEQYYRAALELDPWNLSRYADLGFHLGSRSKISDVQEIMARVQELFDGPDASLLIARLSDFTNRLDESIAWTIRARDQEPNNPLHLEALAELFVDIGDDTQALEISPDPGIGLLMKLRRYPDVIAQAEPLVLEESDDVHLMYLLAFAYNQVGRPEDAIRIFTKLGRSEKNSPAPRQIIDVESNLILADAYAAAGNTDKARVFADRYLYEAHLDSDDWWSHFYSACSHGILGDKERALERLSRVPDSPRMPWNYLLRDMLCFSSLQDDPRYQEILQRFDERRADVRRQLPVTLRRYGVTL